MVSKVGWKNCNEKSRAALVLENEKLAETNGC